ncbi:MAG TPA: hypothetical protein VF699_09915 [Caulobacteraceae bacterium]|jgi:hypothetical protein
MSHSPPPVPPEQRSPGPNAVAGQDETTDSAASNAAGEGAQDRRDNVTNVKDGQPGDAGINTSEQGRYGGIWQNVTHQGLQQDR